jgi:hypothetical protein
MARHNLMERAELALRAAARVRAKIPTMDTHAAAPRIPDGRKMLIYERFFSPAMDYTLEQVYDYIEREAPDDFRVEGATAAFQAKVLAAFPVDEATKERLLVRASYAP